MIQGKGHPLPESEEARHGEIPESLEREKGRGEEGKASVQPAEAVDPEGAPYHYDDLGRGPGEFEQDQRRHQDPGQSDVEVDQR